MELLFLIAFGWLVIEFEPLHLFLRWVYGYLPKSELLEYLFNSFQCWQCMTFWGSLVWTGSFKMAVMASFITFIIETIHELWSRGR